MICTHDGWKFRTSNPIVINRVVEALRRYDVEKALWPMIDRNQNQLMNFVADNIDKLKSETIFEAALFIAYIGTHNPTFSVERLVELFRAANIEQIREVAHHRYLPENEEIVLFRGVAGGESMWRVRDGLSWTDSFAVAAHIARKWMGKYGLQNPQIFQITIHSKDIFLNIGFDIDLDRGGHEFILLPPHAGRIEPVPRAVLQKYYWQDETENRLIKAISSKKFNVLDGIRRHYAGKK